MLSFVRGYRLGGMDLLKWVGSIVLAILMVKILGHALHSRISMVGLGMIILCPVPPFLCWRILLRKKRNDLLDLENEAVENGILRYADGDRLNVIPGMEIQAREYGTANKKLSGEIRDLNEIQKKCLAIVKKIGQWFPWVAMFPFCFLGHALRKAWEMSGIKIGEDAQQVDERENENYSSVEPSEAAEDINIQPPPLEQANIHIQTEVLKMQEERNEIAHSAPEQTPLDANTGNANWLINAMGDPVALNKALDEQAAINERACKLLNQRIKIVRLAGQAAILHAAGKFLQGMPANQMIGSAAEEFVSLTRELPQINVVPTNGKRHSHAPAISIGTLQRDPVAVA